MALPPPAMQGGGKSELINVFIPMLETYNINFLTNKRQKQYLLLKYIIDNNIIYYDDIIKNNNKIKDYINKNIIKNEFNKLNYIYDWLFGFTMAEGSFIIKKSGAFNYQLKQKNNLNLMKDLLSIFNTTVNLTIDKGNNIQLTLSSKKDIQKVINFFSAKDIYSNNLTLLGKKRINYDKWLFELKISNRYKDLTGGPA